MNVYTVLIEMIVNVQSAQNYDRVYNLECGIYYCEPNPCAEML